jgi:broad specificity phosphatase PhoE
MRIDLLRHGECSDQAWLRGKVNSELSTFGRQQMQRQLSLMAEPETVMSSLAKRCAEFTQQTFENRCPFVLDSQWRERDFGRFDGLAFERVKQTYPEALAHYLENPYENNIPQAETFQHFKNRIDQAWSVLIQADFESVLLVTHSGPMRLVLQNILGFSNQQLFQFELGYAARISIEVIPTQTTPFCKLVEIVQAPRQI